MLVRLIGSGAFHGKILQERNTENDKIDAYFWSWLGCVE